MFKLPIGVHIDILIDDLRSYSWKSANILLHYSNTLRDPNIKSNILENKNEESPVTKADIEVNELIINKLKEKYKKINWGILSEENVKVHSNIQVQNFDWLWILDPLDGTKDFIQGTDNYAMHLALNYKGKPILGVVLIPSKNELWISNGKEVWCEKKNGYKEKTKISTKKSLNEMTIVTSKNHGNQILKTLIEKINFKRVVVMGSIGCKIASIVRGESDLYICLSLPGKSSPKDWDFAAPAAILKAAGGAITNLDNQELIYNQPNFQHEGIIVASGRKENHEKVCLEIKNIIQKNKLYPI